MRVVLTIAICAALSGCSGAGLREARLRDIGAQCMEYGHTVGSEAHKNCVMQVDIAGRSAAN